MSDQRDRRRGPRPAQGHSARPRPNEERLTSRKSRLVAGERRAGFAKRALAVGGAAVFGVAMVFARHSYAGHPKHPARPLTAPPRFVGIVRKNLLQAGVVAPAQAPPGAATTVS